MTPRALHRQAPRWPPRCVLAGACAWLMLPGTAHADLQDEIQVYDDSINAPGERGLELHVNTTPHGRSTPNYPGEVPPQHGLRVTPEFSWGLTREWELGLYLPMVSTADRRFDLAGLKLRVKWLPWQVSGGSGFYGGVNMELSRLAERYSASRSAVELRFITGYRSKDWRLAFNPVLGFDLSDGYGGSRPELSLGVKAARTVSGGVAAGLEYYSTQGPAGRSLPWQQQDNRVYLALDIDQAPWAFNIGIGRAVSNSADRWTLKAIIDVPLP